VPLHALGQTYQTKNGPKVSRGKEPIGDAWGKTEPTEAGLRKAYRYHPNAGVGIRLGKVGGVVEIELDGPEGMESLRKLFDGDPPPTLGWSSRLGPHALYRWDDRLAAVGLARFTTPDYPGLEFRGLFDDDRQAQSACPPTLGEDGVPRTWNEHTTIEPLPEAVIERILAAAERHKAKHRPAAVDRTTATPEAPTTSESAPVDPAVEAQVIAELQKCKAAVSGKRGHDTLFAVAVTIGPGFNLDKETAFRLLRDHYNPRCKPPWANTEVWHKVEDAYEKETRRGWMLNGRPQADPLPGPHPSDNGTVAGAEARSAKKPRDGAAAKAGPTHAEILLKLAAPATLFHTPSGRAYACVPVGDHRETLPVRSSAIRLWLVRAFHRKEKRPPTSEALQATLVTLEARALFDGPEEPVFVRVAPGPDGSLFVDLGNASWSAVHVRAGSWEIIGQTAVRFYRPNGLQALATPARGGKLSALKRFGNVRDEDFRLLIAWMTQALQPEGPYPFLAPTGESGTAKTTTGTGVRKLTDPNASQLRSPPKDERDLMISATKNRVVGSCPTQICTKQR
jgi:hypothetical protein